MEGEDVRSLHVLTYQYKTNIIELLHMFHLFKIYIMWQQWHNQVVSVWLLEQFYTHVIIDAWHNLSLHCIWDNVEQKLMLVYKQMPYFTLEIAAWSSFWPDLMISQVALTGKTSHVQVFL